LLLTAPVQHLARFCCTVVVCWVLQAAHGAIDDSHGGWLLPIARMQTPCYVLLCCCAPYRQLMVPVIDAADGRWLLNTGLMAVLKHLAMLCSAVVSLQAADGACD
jgi:hypothetical protein